jgi:hypothetical protein
MENSQKAAINMKSINNILSVNSTVTDLVYTIDNYFPDVTHFHFIIFKPSPGIEQRMGIRRSSALTLWFGKKKWEFEKDLILKAQEKGPKDWVIDKLLAHNDREEKKLIAVPKGQVRQWITEKTRKLDDSEVIGFSSKCIVRGGEIMHLPLMDFSCAPSPENYNFIGLALEKLGEKKGVILASGKSFHYYGMELQTAEEWQRFMHRCLLLSPFTDIRYIAHRLVSGYCILRITSNLVKQTVPQVAGFVGKVNKISDSKRKAVTNRKTKKRAA